MPQKELRKIVRIGQTSMGVILPRAWLRYFALNEGDQVEMISNGKVTVAPLRKVSEESLKSNPS